MQDANFWHKLNIYGRKVIFACGLLFLLATTAQGQNRMKDNLPNYDDRWLHYGFLIGLHSSTYRLTYSDMFPSVALDDLHSIVPENMGGFKLGFISNFKVVQYLDFRALIQVSFYEYQLRYRYTDLTEFIEFRDATMVEFPLLLKYKSVRRGNIGMYLIGGINPAFEASARGEDEVDRERINIRNYNLALDIGFGFDLYFPLFKFSPEIRYSRGLINSMTGDPNPLNLGINRISPHNIGFFITFEGGPS